MRIVTYEEFIRMPAGTIFAPYEPCIFKERLRIKTDTGETYVNPITGEESWTFLGAMPLEPWFDIEDVYPDTYGTYSTEMVIYDDAAVDYMDEKMIAVLEPHEVVHLIEALVWAYYGCKGELKYYDQENN